MRGLLISALILAALAGCSRPASELAAPAGPPEELAPPADAAGDAGDLSAALEALEGNGVPLAPSPSLFDPEHWPPPASPSRSFRGHACTEDCEGHEAGYQWAEENEISDTSDCSTASNSFNEGCETRVEERAEAAAEEESVADLDDPYGDNPW